MANLGNVGNVMPDTGRPYTLRPAYTQDKQPTSVVATGVSIFAGAWVRLFRNGISLDQYTCDGSGNWFFYDLEDSGSSAYSVTAFTAAGQTGEAWVITVVGGTATVTKTFSAQRVVTNAF